MNLEFNSFGRSPHSDMDILHKRIGRKRNERERRRVQGINDLLVNLKDKLPIDWTSPKMSKLEILRKSTSYIKLLMEMTLDEESEIPFDGNLDVFGEQQEFQGQSVCGFKDETFSGSSHSSLCSVGTLASSSGELSFVSNDESVVSDSLESACAFSGNCFPVSSESMSTISQGVFFERTQMSPLFTCNYQPTATQQQCAAVLETSIADLVVLHDSEMSTTGVIDVNNL